MLSNDELRRQCRLLKALQGVSYLEIAEYLEVKPNSFYNWLSQSYDYGKERQERLMEIICNLQES